jgi:hypothetical protein
MRRIQECSRDLLNVVPNRTRPHRRGAPLMKSLPIRNRHLPLHRHRGVHPLLQHLKNGLLPRASTTSCRTASSASYARSTNSSRSAGTASARTRRGGSGKPSRTRSPPSHAPSACRATRTTRPGCLPAQPSSSPPPLGAHQHARNGPTHLESPSPRSKRSTAQIRALYRSRRPSAMAIRIARTSSPT